MKKNTRFFSFIFTVCFVVFFAWGKAQVTTPIMGLLYGMTNYGGDSSKGAIFYDDVLNSTNKIVYSFGTVSGNSPFGSMIQAKDGNLYGMTSSGGSFGFGTVFQYNTSTNTYTVLHNFDSVHGKTPIGSLIQATDGNLYGMTPHGGTLQNGVLFKITTGGTYTVLLNFTGTTGSYIGGTPYGSLMQASDGNLYGMASAGGSSGNGVVFEYTLAGVYSVLVNFTGNSGLYLGAAPRSSLVEEPNYQYLYGMTYRGGTSDDGTIFYIPLGGGGFTNVMSFTGTNGQYPFGDLAEVKDPSGYNYFYGMTYLGGTHNLGVLFNFQAPPQTPTVGVVYNFTSSAGGVGDYPGGSVYLASNDSLYGMTYGGGPLGDGTVFQWDFSANVMKVSDGFNISNGESPIDGNVLEAMTVSIIDTTPSCTTQILEARVRGGKSPYIYSWTGHLTTASIGGITAAGTYTVGVTDANGIKVSAGITLGAYTALNAAAGAKRTSCNGTSDGQAIVVASGGIAPYSYRWSPSNQTTATATGLSSQGYTVTVTDADKCVTIASTTVPQPGVLSTSISSTPTSCHGTADGIATVVPTGGTQPYTYFWTPSSETTATATGLTAQGYSVSVLDSSGCSANNNVNVNQPAVLADSIASVINISCHGLSDGSISVKAYGGTGPYTYSWNIGGSSSSISGLSLGTYSVTVNDAHGCGPVNANASITQPAALNAAISDSNVSCKGGHNGWVGDAVSGGTPPYQFLWNNGGTSSSISNLVAGTYTVSMHDKNGCALNGNTTVNEPATLLTVDTSGTNASCYGTSNGSATAVVSGGNGPYAYSWTGGLTTSTISSLGAGTYTVAVTDNNNCTIKNSFAVKQPANSLVQAHVCMVTVDTGSVHNIITWDKTGLATIDSFKVYFYNSSNKWALLAAVPFSSPGYYVDTASINNPNMNTVRYSVIAQDSCGNQEAFASSPWQNTMHILNIGNGTFSWSGTGYLIQGDPTPVQTYYLLRDNIGNGTWKAIDSVSGSQNTMTDPNFNSYPNGRWRVDALLDVSTCTVPNLRPEAVNYNASKSNTGTTLVTGIKQASSANSVSVYPNPATQNLNVRFNYAKETSANISIADITGRTLLAEQRDIKTGNAFQINIENLPTGLYFIKIETGSSSIVEKFIKE